MNESIYVKALENADGNVEILHARRDVSKA